MSDLDELWKGANDIAFLHIYGQYQWHDTATIRGNRLALTALRDALDLALAKTESEAKVFATDGEGYGIKVVCSDVVSVIGRPEYLYRLEYSMGERAAQREAEHRLVIPSTPASTKDSPQAPSDA